PPPCIERGDGLTGAEARGCSRRRRARRGHVLRGGALRRGRNGRDRLRAEAERLARPRPGGRCAKRVHDRRCARAAPDHARNGRGRPRGESSLMPPLAEALAELLREAERRGEVGAQIAVYRRSDLLAEAWAGTLARGSDRPVNRTTLFPIFSVTKAVTAT